MSAFVDARRVRFIECDPQGRANNAHYLAWIDDAFHAWLARGGDDDLYAHMEELGLMYVLAQAELRYLRPLRFDQRLETVVTPSPPSRSSLAVAFGTRVAGEAEDVFTCAARYVCVGWETERPAPWPERIVAAARRYADSAAAVPLPDGAVPTA